MIKAKQQKKKVQVNALEQINANAAGIDIGAEEIWVAVPGDRDEDNVRSFATFTADLHSLADWLKACHIDTVAMEWNRPGCTGSRYTKSWKPTTFGYIWSMLGI